MGNLVYLTPVLVYALYRKKSGNPDSSTQQNLISRVQSFYATQAKWQFLQVPVYTSLVFTSPCLYKSRFYKSRFTSPVFTSLIFTSPVFVEPVALRASHIT
jgi:hypothetical protein